MAMSGSSIPFKPNIRNPFGSPQFNCFCFQAIFPQWRITHHATRLFAYCELHSFTSIPRNTHHFLGRHRGGMTIQPPHWLRLGLLCPLSCQLVEKWKMCALVSEGGGISFMFFCLVMMCVYIRCIISCMMHLFYVDTVYMSIYELWFPTREDRKTKLSLFEIRCIDVPFVLHNH